MVPWARGGRPATGANEARRDFLTRGRRDAVCREGDADHPDRLRDEHRSSASRCRDSLAKPGGNATGVTFLSDELAAKRLEVLKEAVPQVSRVGFLWNPDHADNELPVARRAAMAFGIQLLASRPTNCIFERAKALRH
jgi:hypothetical protein